MRYRMMCLVAALGLTAALYADSDEPPPPRRTTLASSLLTTLKVYDHGLLRHEGTLSHVKIAPDGKRLITAGFDGTVRVWDLSTGQQQAAFRQPANRVFDFLLLSDGRTLATACETGQIMLWDIATGKGAGKLETGEDCVIRLAMDESGTRMASVGSNNGQCIIWDLKANPPVKIRTFSNGKGDAAHRMYTVFFAGSGSVVTGEDGGGIRRWDLASGDMKVLKAPDPKEEPGPKVVARPLRKPRTSTATATSSAPTTASAPTSATASAPARSGAATTSAPSTTASAPTTRPRRATTSQASTTPASGPSGDIHTLSPSKDGTTAVVSSSACPPWLMDCQTGRMIWLAMNCHDAVRAIWSPDGQSIATADGNSTGAEICLLRASDGGVIWKVLGPATPYALDFTSDGSQIICGWGNAVCRLDARTGERLFPPKDQPLRCGGIEQIIAIPGTNTLAVAGGDGALVDRATGKARSIATTESALYGQSCQFSPSGEFMACELDRQVTVFETRTGGRLGRFFPEGDFNGRVIITQDGSVVKANYDQSAVYDRLGRKRFDLPGVDGDCLARGPHDVLAGLTRVQSFDAAGSYDYAANAQAVTFWSLLDGEPLGQLPPVDREAYDSGRLHFLATNPPSLVLAGNRLLGLYQAQFGQARRRISEADARAVIGQLQADEYRLREEATQRLLDAGRDILPLLTTAPTDNPEARARIDLVRKALALPSYKFVGVMPCGQISCFAVHPDGRHFVAVEEKKLLVGRVEPGRLEVMGVVAVEAAPTAITFDAQGRLLVGYANGALAEYALDISALPAPESVTTASAPVKKPKPKRVNPERNTGADDINWTDDSTTLPASRPARKRPTSRPTTWPTTGPITQPTSGPTSGPAPTPTSGPTTEPTAEPTTEPTTEPTVDPDSEDRNEDDTPVPPPPPIRRRPIRWLW